MEKHNSMSIKSSLRKFVPEWLINVYHWKMAALAAVRYGFPTRKLKVVGITGTNGKTTTAFMVESLLRTKGEKVGIITTAKVGVHGKLVTNPTKMTTPDVFILNRWLSELRKAGCKWIVMEVTSHGLAQHRAFGIKFDTVIFTNLTHDHLDYHKTKEDYRNAKLKLFSVKPRVAIANLDDPEGEKFLSFPAERHYGFTVEGGSTSKVPGVTVLRGTILRATDAASDVQVTTPASDMEITIPLPGKFNVENALAAVAVGYGADMKMETIQRGIAACSDVPGRMELIDRGQPFKVIVDYAHTPDALKRVFETLRPTVKGKLIHVGGATGDRDRTKRPILGALAGQYSDIAIVTDEDPGTEDPLKIIEAVADGVRRGQRPKRIENENFFVVPNRRDAIEKAILMAKKDDVVLITGKGHEEVMAVAGSFVPFSDRKIATEVLESR